MLRSLWQRFENWWRSLAGVDQWAWVSVAVATVLGASYRLVSLRQTMQFLADQGRDAIIAYGIFHGDFTLVGPSTSVGDMFLGPFYYYFMAPWLALAGNDPIGPTLAVAALGILTVPLLYWVGKQFVGTVPAVLATLLYATAPVAIEYTRFSWNPNPAPFVMLFLLYGTWKAWRSSARWWLLVAVSWAVLIQLHYVALLSLAPAGIFWLADVYRTLRAHDVSRLRSLALWTVLSIGLVLLSWLPLVLFDFRFNHLISKGFTDFLDGDPTKASIPLWEALAKIWREQHGRAMHVLFEVWGGKDWTVWYRQINSWLLVGYAIMAVSSLLRWWKTEYRAGAVLILLTLSSSILGLAWYPGTVFHHYITYLLPAAYLLTGMVLVELARRFSWLGIFFSAGVLMYIFWLSVLPSTLLYLKPLGWDLDDYKSVSQIIAERVPADASYSLANLSEIRDYRGLSYRYFLLIGDHPPAEFEVSGDAEYLVIVAENPKESDAVLSSPVYEVSQFPKGEYEFIDVMDGPRLYFIQRAETQTEGLSE